MQKSKLSGKREAQISVQLHCLAASAGGTQPLTSLTGLRSAQRAHPATQNDCFAWGSKPSSIQRPSREPHSLPLLYFSATRRSTYNITFTFQIHAQVASKGNQTEATGPGFIQQRMSLDTGFPGRWSMQDRNGVGTALFSSLHLGFSPGSATLIDCR